MAQVMREQECAGCGQDIWEDAIGTEFGIYHQNCFKCTRCPYVFPPGSETYVVDGKPICSSCYAVDNSCDKCKKILNGPYSYQNGVKICKTCQP